MPVVLQGNSGVPLSLYVGERGELVMDYNAKTLRLHDGSTVGGISFQASSIALLSGSSTTAQAVTTINSIITALQNARLMA